MSLPRVLKRIRLELARSKEFPMGSANHGYEFVASLDSKGHIDPQGCAGFGEAPTKKSGDSCTSPAGQSTRNGCSIAIQIRPTTTRPDIASGCTPSHPASMFQSVIMRVRPTPSRSCRLNQPCNRARKNMSLG